MDRIGVKEYFLSLELSERAQLLNELIEVSELHSFERAWVNEAESRLDAFERGELEEYSMESVMDDASRLCQ